MKGANLDLDAALIILIFISFLATLLTFPMVFFHGHFHEHATAVETAERLSQLYDGGRP